MSTLYRPVLIETAEQAEALPIGTTTTNVTTTRSGTWYAPPRVNIGRGLWAGDDLYGSVDMVGWTALVPIEAEEEWTAMGSDHGDPWIARVSHDGIGIDGSREEAQRYVGRFGGFIAHRALTPWEEA